MRTKPTKRSIDAVKYRSPSIAHPRGAHYLWDSEVAGFGLRVYPSGRESFPTTFRIRGKQRFFTIGRYGEMLSALRAPKQRQKYPEKAMAIELTHTLTFRLGPELHERLAKAALLNHLTVSEVARHRLEGLEIKPRRRVVADEELLRQLVRVGSNLNQQTRVLLFCRLALCK